MDKFQALLTQALGGDPPPRGAIARMARATKVRDNVIARWLSPTEAHQPSPANLMRVAPFLGVPYEQLIAMIYGGDQDGGAQANLPPRKPLTPTDRLLRVADVMAEASAELRRAVMDLERSRRRARTTASSVALGGPVQRARHTSVDAQSPLHLNPSYVSQENVIPFPVSIPRLGGLSDREAA